METEHVKVETDKEDMPISKIHMMQLELDIVDDDPASRTERLLLQRGLDAEDSSDWSDCVEEEWEYLKIKDWLETNPDADDMAVINKILEVCILPELRERPDRRLDIGCEMTEAEKVKHTTPHDDGIDWLENAARKALMKAAEQAGKSNSTRGGESGEAKVI